MEKKTSAVQSCVTCGHVRRFNWCTFILGVFAGFILCVVFSPHADAAEKPAAKMSAKKNESAKREQAMLVYDTCMKIPLVSEVYRPSFALLVARDAHIVDESMQGNPAALGTSLCVASQQDSRQWTDKVSILNALSHGDLSLVAADVEWDKNLDKSHRLLVPYARDYFTQLADDFGAVFPGRKFKVTSMLRTVSEQRALVKKKMTPLDCDPAWFCSAHVSGIAFDISLRGLTKNEVEYLHIRLRADIARSKVLAIKEGLSGCFHVQVIDPKFLKMAADLLDTPVPPSSDGVERINTPGPRKSM